MFYMGVLLVFYWFGMGGMWVFYGLGVISVRGRCQVEDVGCVWLVMVFVPGVRGQVNRGCGGGG